MKIHDSVNNTEVEVDGIDGLIECMKNGRQVDLFWDEEKQDEDGYIIWDVEHWATVDDRKFIRTYTLKGKPLGEYTHHNIYDLKNSFHPEKAVKVELS